MAKIRRIEWIWKTCREYGLFLFLLLAYDLLFGFFLWLLDERGFWVLIGVFAVLSVGVFGVAVRAMVHREEKRRQMAEEYLEHPEEAFEQRIFQEFSPREAEQLVQIGKELQEKENTWQSEHRLRKEYESYVEIWAHEIKVPLSLMTLLLDNRREEMSPVLYQRLLYVRRQISEYVTQILYYARLKASHRDDCLERISLQECCEEALDQYKAVLEEERIYVSCDVDGLCVISDRKGLLFILEQVIGNACKYMDEDKSEKYLKINGFLDSQKNKIVLNIADNGIGVKRADLPFLFDQGFTGDTDARKRKATGMGLYLVKQMAENLNVEVQAESEYGEGFVLEMEFPVVER